MAIDPAKIRKDGRKAAMFTSLLTWAREWGSSAAPAAIGTTTPAAGNFTTLDASGDISVNGTTDSSSSTTGSIQTNGGLGVVKKAHFGNRVTIENTAPQLRFIDTNAPLDEGDWELAALSDGSFSLRALTEAGGAGGKVFSAFRTGTVIDVVDFLANNIITGGISTDGGSNYFKTKIIDIGDWNMDTVTTVSVAHGLADHQNIRKISVIIRADGASGPVTDLPKFDFTETTAEQHGITVNATNAVLRRGTGGVFDSVAFNQTSFNRGWIVIDYIV